ncbi:MAG: hypothetical protein AB1611_11025 [bacterium]
MLYDSCEKDDSSTSTLIMCETCGCTFNLLDKFLPSLKDLTCGQCDTKGNFKVVHDPEGRQ